MGITAWATGKIHRRQVPLKAGGSVVIDQTEALVAIDVNSGNFRADASLGHLITSVKDPVTNLTSFAYDSRDRLTTETITLGGRGMPPIRRGRTGDLIWRYSDGSEYDASPAPGARRLL